jgi:hypothetical protein
MMTVNDLERTTASASPSAPVADIAALADYQALEHLLLVDLLQLLDEPETPQTRGWLLTILDRLLDMLPRQLELQTRDGFAARVRDERPDLHDRLQSLRSAEFGGCALLEKLHASVSQQLPLAPLAEELQEVLRRWMEALARRRRQEGKLLQQALNSDLGGEG